MDKRADVALVKCDTYDDGEVESALRAALEQGRDGRNDVRRRARADPPHPCCTVQMEASVRLNDPEDRVRESSRQHEHERIG